MSGGSAAENGWEVRLLSADAIDPLSILVIERDGPDTYTIVSGRQRAGADEFYGRCTTLAREVYHGQSGTLIVDSSTDTVV